jgi:acyl-CoA ligase (AMP-forming) (exosortase A-associated)
MLPYLFHHLVENTQKQYPKHIALYDKQQQLSYTQLQNNIETITVQLLSLGLSKADRVAIYLGKSIESVISYFAVSACGAIFVPINPYLKSRQVDHILRDCTPKILITSTQRLHQLQTYPQTISTIEHIILVDQAAALQPESSKQHSWSAMLKQTIKQTTYVEENSLTAISDTDTAAILYTSGSTGKAKGVMLSHKNLLCGAQSVSSYLKNNHHDKILAVLPFSFDYGLSQLTTAFYSGASVVLLDYLLPRDVIKAIIKYQITGLAAVPPLWIQLAELKWPEQAKKTLRYFTNSGGVLPKKTLYKLRQLLPDSLPYLMYGLTEAFRSTYLEPKFIDSHANSIGKAIPNAEILIVNNEGILCNENEVGELVHRGPLVAKGYWNNVNASAKTFRPISSILPQQLADEMAVWSGDLAKYDSDGFIYFIERNDEMIKSSGYRISPTEIEEVFMEHESIVNAIAIGLPHPQLGQSILLICTINSVISVEDLKTFAKQYLPSFMCPKDIIIENQLPQTSNGKIDRLAIVKKFMLVS